MSYAADEQKKYHFLQDGGEMGSLTRSFDWSSTVVGPVDQWPQTLRATVGIILHSDFPMFLWWGDNLIQFYNDAYRPSLGMDGKHPKALGQKGVECWPEIWSVIHPLIVQVKATGKSFFAEDQLIPIFRNGRLEDVYWTFSYSPVIAETGSIDGVLVVCHETTRKIQDQIHLEDVKRKVEKSEANLRNMILHAPVAMCIMLGPDHVVDIANEMMIELWGKPVEEVMNKPIFEGLPDAKDQGLEQVLRQVYESGETFSASERPVSLLRKNKVDIVYQNFVYEPYRDSSGKIVGVLAVTTDVTEQVKAMRKIEEVVAERTLELEQVNKDLKKSNAELTQFAYISSHDLQEPARKISTFVEMLKQTLGEGIDERSKLYMSKIELSSMRMLRLIRDILALSQLSRANYQFERVDLDHSLEQIINDFELTLEQTGAVIERDTLPTIDAIPVQMSQLFSNLLSNALKFLPAGKAMKLQIRSSVLSPEKAATYPALITAERYHELSFSDNGIGFSQQNALQIFDIFQRLHGRSEYQGTGIGLAMCKKIAENHGGHIFAMSASGEGATFTIILPERQR